MKIQDKNGLRDATAEEIAENNEVSKLINAEQKAKIDEANARETNQASGNQKLLDLGLTQAEATALTGYTPPVAE